MLLPCSDLHAMMFWYVRLPSTYHCAAKSYVAITCCPRRRGPYQPQMVVPQHAAAQQLAHKNGLLPTRRPYHRNAKVSSVSLWAGIARVIGGAKRRCAPCASCQANRGNRTR